ncbi:MAG TPA: hypothetical protein VF666_16000 [Pyrinomonadaceae bacterium]
MATVLTPIVATTSEMTSTGTAPIIIDLGKEKKKRIKDLKRGRGRLMAEVAAVLNEVRTGLGDEGDSKQLVPIVLIYKKKRKGKGGGGGGGLFPFFF